MKNNYSQEEICAVADIVAELSQGHIEQGISLLRELKQSIYDAIPQKTRIGRGITWVVQRISDLLSEECSVEEDFYQYATLIYGNLPANDKLLGVPIFMMAEYGKINPTQVYDFFEQASDSEDWIVREFSAGGFHMIIKPQRDIVHPWLMQTAQCSSPKRRRFASETLRPVTLNHWISDEPEYSLSVLRLLFQEKYPYPRTSVGNNLSDLSRKNPELILDIVKGLAASGDENSYWIAYRACRNLVKKYPLRVMDLLAVDEYHYKDRNFYRHEPV